MYLELEFYYSTGNQRKPVAVFCCSKFLYDWYPAVQGYELLAKLCHPYDLQQCDYVSYQHVAS